MAMQGMSYIRVPTGARTEISSAVQPKAIKAYAASNGIALPPAVSMDEGNTCGSLLIDPIAFHKAGSRPVVPCR